MKKNDTKKFSKKEKRDKLFFKGNKEIVPMNLNGHWNNDSGCRPTVE